MIFTIDNDFSKTKLANKEYEKYIYDHIANIKKAFNEYGEKLNSLLDFDSSILKYNVSNHDKSKFDSEEFVLYRKKFYPVTNEEYSEDDFNKAWLHHIKNNNHHWNSWSYIDNEGVVSVEIPDIYIAEMVLDWIAMSMTKGGDPLKFYNSKKDTIILHKKSREKLENVLNTLF